MAKIITISKGEKTVAGIEYTSPSGETKQVQLPATFTHNGVKHTTTTPTQAHADAYEAMLIENTIKAQNAYANRTPEQIAKDNEAIEANRRKMLEKEAGLSPEEKAKRSQDAKDAYANRTPEQIEKDNQAIEANRQKQLEIRANMTPEELEAERQRGIKAAQANELTL